MDVGQWLIFPWTVGHAFSYLNFFFLIKSTNYDSELWNDLDFCLTVMGVSPVGNLKETTKWLSHMLRITMATLFICGIPVTAASPKTGASPFIVIVTPPRSQAVWAEKRKCSSAAVPVVKKVTSTWVGGGTRFTTGPPSPFTHFACWKFSVFNTQSIISLTGFISPWHAS